LPAEGDGDGLAALIVGEDEGVGRSARHHVVVAEVFDAGEGGVADGEVYDGAVVAVGFGAVRVLTGFAG